MSFILDAIAKSEQERQQQEVTGAGILALPAGNVPQPRRLLPYLVIGALLLNAAVLVIWMQSGQTLLDWFSPKQIETMDSPIQPATIGETNAGLVSEPENFQVNPAVNATDGDTGSTGVTSNAITPEAITDNDKTTTGLSSEPEKRQSEPAVTAANGDPTDWIRIEPDTLLNKARSEHQAVDSNNTQNTDLMPRKVSSLGELPSAVRNALPRVVFSGHLYSSNPNSSVVFVNDGRPLMRGRQIEGELYLHEITPTGVIVEFRGYLIDVGVLQNWTLK